MNLANQNLMALQHTKQMKTKAYNEAKNKLEKAYAEDMKIIDEEIQKILTKMEE